LNSLRFAVRSYFFSKKQSSPPNQRSQKDVNVRDAEENILCDRGRITPTNQHSSEIEINADLQEGQSSRVGFLKQEKADSCLPSLLSVSITARSLLILWGDFCRYLFATCFLVFYSQLISHLHIFNQGSSFTIEAHIDFSAL